MFSELPAEIVLDSTRSTTLTAEHLLDSTGKLRLTKTWIKPSSAPSVSVMAVHPHDDAGQPFLINQKITALKALARDLEVSDRRVSAELRAAIFANRIAAGSAAELREIPLTSEDGKAVATELAKYLPHYRLFRADRLVADSDGLAQDPAREAVRTVLAKHSGTLDELSEKVVGEIRSMLDGVVEKLHEIDPELADHLSVTEIKPDWSKAFSGLHFEDDQGVPLAKRGNGTRRLVLLSFFRAATSEHSDQTGGDPRAVITAIEEPEMALHPDLQNELIRTIEELGSTDRHQAIITTHSSNLVRNVPATSVRYITTQNSTPTCISVGPNDDPTKLLRELNSSLGVLTDHSVRCFFLVEGARDIAGLTHLSKSLQAAGTAGVTDLDELVAEGRLCILPVGGCGGASLWEDRVSPLQRPQITLFDSDRTHAGASLKVQVEAVRLRTSEHREVHILDRRELENYLTPEAISHEFRDLAGFPVAFNGAIGSEDWHYLDIPVACAIAAHSVSESSKAWDDLSAADQRKKTGHAKKRLERAFAHESVGQELIARDADIVAILNRVSASCGSGAAIM